MTTKKQLITSLPLKIRIKLFFNILFNQERIAYDQSTGALNRIFGMKMLEQIHNNRDLYFALVFCDLDFLKEVNGYYGHRTGDMFLKKFVESAKKNTRKGDLIIRWGGDEFIIVLIFSLNNKNNSYEKLSKKEEIRKKIDTIMKRISKDFPFFSYGYVFDSKKTINEIINLADKRMYTQKKKRKKNREETLERIKDFIKIQNKNKITSKR